MYHLDLLVSLTMLGLSENLIAMHVLPFHKKVLPVPRLSLGPMNVQLAHEKVTSHRLHIDQLLRKSSVVKS